MDDSAADWSAAVCVILATLGFSRAIYMQGSAIGARGELAMRCRANLLLWLDHHSREILRFPSANTIYASISRYTPSHSEADLSGALGTLASAQRKLCPSGPYGLSKYDCVPAPPVWQHSNWVRVSICNQGALRKTFYIYFVVPPDGLDNLN